MQRSILHLIRGDLSQSWQANPGGIALLILGTSYVFTQAHNRKDQRQTRNILVGVFIFLLLINWFAKMGSHACCI